MNVIPAIDLKDGKCVRLYQGDFERCTEYSDDPTAVARSYQHMGLEHLHIIDLDGAELGEQKNRGIVATIALQSELEIQLGGGIRDAATLAGWLAAGVTRCIVGSLAVNEPETIKRWLDEFGPDRIVLALDVRLDVNDRPLLMTHGWKESSQLDLWQCIDGYLDHGITHVLCTDVSRDGAMTGPNLELYREFIARYPALRLQASGGIRNVADLHSLEELGPHAAISGRALLDGTISKEELQSFLRVA